jgi:sugar lactone lactonase YvrE
MRAGALLTGLVVVTLGAVGARSEERAPDPAERLPRGASGAPVFPPPPERARVRYVRSIEGPMDASARGPWWKRLFGLLAGRAEPVSLVRPYGVEACGDTLYVCDAGAGVVHVFVGGGEYLRIPREGSLASPIDVAVDRAGRVHVSDSARRVVECFDPRGRLLFRHGGTFERPTGLAYHPGTDRLYVVDTKAHRVLIQSAEGVRVGSFGKRGAAPGEFNFPTAVHVDAQGRLYVTDAMNFRVELFEPDGRFVACFGGIGDRPGYFSKPKGLTTDRDGNVWVVDASFDAGQIFDSSGRLLLSFGGPGRDPGEFWLPTGIAMGEDDLVYVADSYNRRVQVFRYLGEEEPR